MNGDGWSAVRSCACAFVPASHVETRSVSTAVLFAVNMLTYAPFTIDDVTARAGSPYPAQVRVRRLRSPAPQVIGKKVLPTGYLTNAQVAMAEDFFNG